LQLAWNGLKCVYTVTRSSRPVSCLRNAYELWCRLNARCNTSKTLWSLIMGRCRVALRHVVLNATWCSRVEHAHCATGSARR